MADSNNVLSMILTGGVGATVGGLLTAVVQTLSGRGQSKAAAADLVSKAAGSIVARLDQENKALREAVLLLIEVMDEVSPELNTHPHVARKLLAARRAAERAIL